MSSLRPIGLNAAQDQVVAEDGDTIIISKVTGLVTPTDPTDAVPKSLFDAIVLTPGPKGDTGVAGPKGDTGTQGAQGIQGPKGDTGQTGLTGAQGVPGTTGATGTPGVAGTNGTNGTNGSKILSGAATPTGGSDGDYYLTTGNLLYGPRASGTWPSTALGQIPTTFTVEALVRATILNNQKRHQFWEDWFTSPDYGPYYTANSTGSTTHVYGPAYFGGIGIGARQLSTLTVATNYQQFVYGYAALPGRLKRYRSTIHFYMPVLSTTTDTFTLFIGEFQGNGARRHLTLQYTHGVNGGRFQLVTANGSTVVDTGVTPVANTIYAFDYYVEVTTPGVNASNPFVATITDVTNNGTPVVLTGNCICGQITGQSLDTGMVGACISKSVGTTACLLFLTYLSCFAEAL